jgi:hypothetical protein
METIKYMERTSISTETTAQGNAIFEMRNRLPIFYKGHELKSYEIEAMFRESTKQWIIRIDTLDAYHNQLIILKSKF